MALALQKNLAVSICPQSDNPEGNKFQGQLREVGADAMQLFVAEPLTLSPGDPVVVEFKIEKNQFSFEAKTQSMTGSLLPPSNPAAIKRSRLREGHRLAVDMKMAYTPWTESGRFETTLVDLSEMGVRMIGRKQLKKGMLVSIDFYVKEDKIRVLCQGQVAWWRATPDNDQLFETGVEFTTISNETRKRLTKFILRKNGGEEKGE